MIHSLNKIDKHRLLTTVGCSFRSVNLGAQMIRDMERRMGRSLPKMDVFYRVADPMCPLKAGDELGIDLPDAEVDEKLQFRFDIAFSEPRVTNCEPVLETLQQMIDLIDNLLPIFRPLL